MQISAGKRNFITLYELTPNGQEFIGQSIAAVVVIEDSLPGKLIRFAAGNRVDQASSAGKAIESQLHPCRRRWGHQSRTDCYKKLCSSGCRYLGGGNDPGILAEAPR